MDKYRKDNEKIKSGSFFQKVLNFRLNSSIFAWKLAIALFLLIAIAYTVNGAGVIAKGNNLEVSGNATVQGKVGIGTTAPDFLLNVVSSGTTLPVEISASSSGTGDSFGLLRLFRLNSAVSDEAGIIFSLQDTQPARQEYGYIAAKISASTSGSEAGDLLFSTTNAGVIRQERMRITSAGNIGIGTTEPAVKLHVVKPDSSTGVIDAVPMFIRSENNLPSDTAGVKAGIDFRINNGIANSRAAIYLENKGGGNRADLVIAPDVGATTREVMRFTTDGNVGIGTASPASKLDVAGSVEADGFTINGAPLGTSTDSFWSASGGNIYYNSGNVGIGTPTPGSELHVQGQLKVDSTINDKLILAGTQAAPHTIFLDNSKGIRFWDNVNGELMRITNTGNVGIGTIPNPALSTKLRIKGGGITQGSYQLYTENEVGTIGLTVTDAGNVGIGTTSPSAKLHIENAASAGASVGLNLIADIGGTSIINLGYPAGPGRAHITSYLNDDRVSIAAGGQAEVFHIKNNNVGIGDTSPGNTISIAKQADVTGIGQTGNALTLGVYSTAHNPSERDSFIQSFNGNLIINPLGNKVGIGTTSPGAQLDARSDTVQNINWGGLTAKKGVISWGATGAKVRGASGVALQLGSNDIDDRLTIATDGNVGIGTANPESFAKLDVAGSLRVHSATEGNLYLEDDNRANGCLIQALVGACPGGGSVLHSQAGTNLCVHCW